jgi:predicted dehydrogenase/threonine dehydrogenase-like Zn-dependent dehydrogenase
MRQLFLQKGSIKIEEVADPALMAGCIKVAVHYSCISPGTESATIAHAAASPFFSNVGSKIGKVVESVTTNGIAGTKALIQAKLAGTIQQLGYACAGQVIAVGEQVHRFNVGDWVACAGAGFANHADTVIIPEQLAVKLKNEHQLKQASVTTLGAIALQGIRRAQLQLGETVCILGLGLLGQLSVQLATQAGCKVIGVDIKSERLEMACSLGAEQAFLATDPNIIQHIQFATEHQGVDCTIITAASVSDSIIQQAFELTRKKGKVVIVGDVGLGLQRSPLYQKEIDVLISCSYGPGRYDPFYEQEGLDYPFAYVRWTENRNMATIAQLIEEEKLRIDPLIGYCVPIEQAPKAYEMLKEGNAYGIILSYMPKKEEKPSVIINIASLTNGLQPIASPVRVGCVGVGGFAQIKLLPLISRINKARIRAIVDTNSATAINVARQYGCAHAFLEDGALLVNDLVDAVVIASPHALHAEQTLRALHGGKAVFTEKPLLVTRKELEIFRALFIQYPQLPLCVDFNRSFAPFILKIKEVLAHRKNPFMAMYRMNAGYIEPGHWVQRPLGAGRIIGEACHILDLFCALTNAHPTAVSVEALRSQHSHLLPTDNVSVQLSFSDGSVCTLLYTAIGNTKLGKERLELFVDGMSIVMDDYTSLQGYGLPYSINQRVSQPDKGHFNLLNAFFESCITTAKGMPISTERLLLVSELAILINELAREGGGAHALNSATYKAPSTFQQRSL